MLRIYLSKTNSLFLWKKRQDFSGLKRIFNHNKALTVVNTLSTQFLKPVFQISQGFQFLYT